MGSGASSAPQTASVYGDYKCIYCGVGFQTSREADYHEYIDCPLSPRRQSTGKFDCRQSVSARLGRHHSPHGASRTSVNRRTYSSNVEPAARSLSSRRSREACSESYVVTRFECKRCHTILSAPFCRKVSCPRCQSVSRMTRPSASIPLRPYNLPDRAETIPAVEERLPRHNANVQYASGRRKAVIIGCEYKGTLGQLSGSSDAVDRMLGLLTDMYGFTNNPVTVQVLQDNAETPYAPTRKQILRLMQWLVQDACPGDVLFFLFVGHGAQQPDKNATSRTDYMDDAILPTDFQKDGMIVDDELFDNLVCSLPSGVKLTAVFDCCHPGTSLNLPFRLENSRFKEQPDSYHTVGDVTCIYGKPQGTNPNPYDNPHCTLTNALCSCLEQSRGSDLSYSHLLEGLQQELYKVGDDFQIPMISSSQCFDSSKKFTLIDGIERNQNMQIGRWQPKKKLPKRKNLLVGGLAEILGSSASGFIDDIDWDTRPTCQGVVKKHIAS